MSIQTLITLPDGTTVETPEQAEAAGYPVTCEAFALCTNAASVLTSHPILGAYPACERCAARLAA